MSTKFVRTARRSVERCVLAVVMISAVVFSRPLDAQSALIGTVMVAKTERPLADVEVVIASLKLSARTDSIGDFEIQGVPAGKYEVTIRFPGYEPLTALLLFAKSRPVESDFLLTPIGTELAKVNVKAKVSLREAALADFESRRHFGLGKFITADVFDSAGGRLVSNVLTQKIPGLLSEGNGSSSRYLATMRMGHDPKNPCYVQVIVNGMVRYLHNRGPEFDINSIVTDQILGVEFYTVSQTPSRFNTTGAECGTLLVWTK